LASSITLQRCWNLSSFSSGGEAQRIGCWSDGFSGSSYQRRESLASGNQFRIRFAASRRSTGRSGEGAQQLLSPLDLDTET